MIDTLKYAKILESGGLPRNQAEAHIKVISDIFEGDMITKQEFNKFRIEEFNSFKEQVEQRFDQIDLKFEKLENKITYKLGGYITFLIGATAAFMKFSGH